MSGVERGPAAHLPARGRSLQLAVAAWLLVTGVESAASSLVNLGSARATVGESLRKGGLAGSQLDQAVNFTVTFGLAVTIALSILYLVVAAGSLRGATWAFWVALVLLALDSAVALFGLVGLATRATEGAAAGWLWAGEILQLLGLALFVWALVALIRGGPWSRRQPGVTDDDRRA